MTISRHRTLVTLAATALAGIALTCVTACERRTQAQTQGRGAATTVPVVLKPVKTLPAMEETLAKLGLKELPSKDFDVTKVPTVVKARLQAENADARYNRGKKLFEAQPPLMSEQDFADLETALRVARSTYDVELL